MTSLHADDAFLSFYQFSHDPFTPRVPGFKFYPAQRKSVLGQLHHLARYGQLLLLVTGPKGSGKTLLRQALVASTNKQAVQSLVLSGREATTVAGILGQVGRGIEASASSVSAILNRAGQLSLTGQEVYLLVDDAGLLEDEALQALFQLAAGNGEGRVHVFLFAEAELGARLKSSFEIEEGFHCTELQPYTDYETREYLAQRLEGAGQSLELLTDEQVENIHTSSGGWPGAINEIARESMIDSMIAHRDVMDTRKFSFKLPAKHLLALLIVFAAVVAVWFMKSEKSTVPPVVSPQVAGAVQVDDDSTKPGFSVEFSNKSTEQKVAQPIVREPLAMASAEADSEDAVDVLSAPSADETSVPVSGPVTVGTVPLPLPSNSSANMPTTVPDKVAVGVPAVVANGNPVLTAPISPSATAPAVAQAQTQAQKPAAKPAVAEPIKRDPVLATTSTASVDWYRSQASSRFALQILGTRSEGNARAFVKQNGGDYRYYVKMHQGAPLYVVTFGVFTSREAAAVALTKLPAKIQAGKPWPKTFASIQQEILKGQ